MKNNIINVIKRAGFDCCQIGKNYNLDKVFITSLYKHEPFPIFEHSSFHVLSYLGYCSKLYAAKGEFGATILVERNEVFFLFTPRIDNEVKFFNFIHKLLDILDYETIEIQNVSHNTSRLIQTIFPNCRKIARSRKEVIYGVEKLNKLEGKSFSGLRQTRNRLLRSNRMTFVTIDGSNVNLAISVLLRWQSSQGTKYLKNKYDKEVSVLKKFVRITQDDNSLKLFLGIVDKKPISISAFHQLPNFHGWGVIYMIKGLNRKSDHGIRGASDAAYLHVIELANKLKLDYLNDGELGDEEGARAHKMSFKPIKFLKSFDIFIKKHE